MASTTSEKYLPNASYISQKVIKISSHFRSNTYIQLSILSSCALCTLSCYFYRDIYGASLFYKDLNLATFHPHLKQVVRVSSNQIVPWVLSISQNHNNNNKMYLFRSLRLFAVFQFKYFIHRLCCPSFSTPDKLFVSTYDRL